MEEDKEKVQKPTWYSLHKEQIKLIQWLLYHLKKHEKEEKKRQESKMTQQDFLVNFD